MSQLVLVTRPIEQALKFAEQIKSLGFDPILQPVLKIEYTPFSFDTFEDYNGLILSSAQSIQNQLIPRAWEMTPVFCVGEMTAHAAIQSGFKKIFTGQGGLLDLIPLIERQVPASGKLLYLRGENVRHDLNKVLTGYSIYEQITYQAKPILQISPDVLDRFGQIDVITVFSARSGAVLRQLIKENGLTSHTPRIKLLCLSPSVVESMVEMNWKSCAIPDFPNQRSVIEKLKSL